MNCPDNFCTLVKQILHSYGITTTTIEERTPAYDAALDRIRAAYNSQNKVLDLNIEGLDVLPPELLTLTPERIILPAGVKSLPTWFSKLESKESTIEISTTSETLSGIENVTARNLKLVDCPNLREVTPSPSRYPNIHSSYVFIDGCPEFQYGTLREAFRNLRYLSVKNCKLSRKDIEHIVALSRIKAIKLANTGISDEDIPPIDKWNAKNNMANTIQFVYLSGNNLTKLPRILSDASAFDLLDIDISQNPITELPNDLDTMFPNGIGLLKLSGTRIAKLPDNIYKTKITELNLTNTKVDPLAVLRQTYDYGDKNKVREVVLSGDENTFAMVRDAILEDSIPCDVTYDPDKKSISLLPQPTMTHVRN